MKAYHGITSILTFASMLARVPLALGAPIHLSSRGLEVWPNGDVLTLPPAESVAEGTTVVVSWPTKRVELGSAVGFGQPVRVVRGADSWHIAVEPTFLDAVRPTKGHGYWAWARWCVARRRTRAR